MKLWKSPVLYFGIALVLAVAAAFIAPYVIDWGSYRMAIEKLRQQGDGAPGNGRGRHLGPVVSLAKALYPRR